MSEAEDGVGGVTERGHFPALCLEGSLAVLSEEIPKREERAAGKKTKRGETQEVPFPPPGSH